MKLPCLRRAGRDGELPSAYLRRFERPGRSRGSDYNAWLHVSTRNTRCIGGADRLPELAAVLVFGARMFCLGENILEKSRTRCWTTGPTVAAPQTARWVESLLLHPWTAGTSITRSVIGSLQLKAIPTIRDTAMP